MIVREYTHRVATIGVDTHRRSLSLTIISVFVVLLAFCILMANISFGQRREGRGNMLNCNRYAGSVRGLGLISEHRINEPHPSATKHFCVHTLDMHHATTSDCAINVCGWCSFAPHLSSMWIHMDGQHLLHIWLLKVEMNDFLEFGWSIAGTDLVVCRFA